MLYVFFGLVAAIAAVVLIRPLLTNRALADGALAEQAVYRAQLREIAAEREAGLIAAADADGAVLEIERRLLRAAGRQIGSGGPARRSPYLLAAVVGLVVPVATAALYDLMGRPDLPDAPLAARLTPEGSAAEATQLVDRLAARMQANPNDARGWALLANARAEQGRYLDAARAYEQIVRLVPDDLGSMLQAAQFYIVAGQGRVGPEADRLIALAAKLAPQAPGVRHFLAYQKLDHGNATGAEADWRALAESLPADAPLRNDALTGIASARQAQNLPPINPAVIKSAPVPAGQAPAAPAPGPDAAAVDQAAQMSAADRQTMIEGMVARLAERLKTNPDDLDGWQRLARAYEVMGRFPQAADAWDQAARLKPDDPSFAAKAAELRAKGR